MRSTRWRASWPRGRRCSPTSSRSRSPRSSCRTTSLCFWEPLGHGPGDVIFGVGLIVALALLNIKGTEESARLNLVLAIADLLTQIVLVGIGLILVFDGDLLLNQIDLGVAPTLGGLRARDRGGDGRLYGHRDDLEHGGGGEGRPPHDPARYWLRGCCGCGAVRAPAGDRAIGDAGDAGCERRVHDGAGDGVRGRSGAGDRREPRAWGRRSRMRSRSTWGSWRP